MAAVFADADFESLESEIYEAALVPERWRDVLERLTGVAGGVGGALWSSRDGTAAWIASDRMTPITERFVAGGWGMQNPRYEASVAKGLTHLPRFITEADLFDSDAFAEEPFFTDFMFPEGLGWSATTSFHVPDHDLLALSVERARADGPIPPAAVAYLDRLRPHLARSALIAGRLSFERARTAVSALSQLGFEAAAISGGGQVLVANAQFEAGEGWILRAGDRIAIEDEQAAELYADALMRIATASGVRSIPLSRSGSKIDAVMHLVPIRGEAHDLFSRAAAIVVITRSSNGTGGPDLIQTLFDLTPTEALVARRVSDGATAEQIASATGKSVLTIRTQLKSVLAKTGTRRQSELVHLLTRLVPPAL